MTTIATLKRMSAAQLSELILAGAQNLAIVDVRDGDYIGGHIKGALHFPSGTFESTLPTLMRQLKDSGVDTVVFHCALSQQRGPGAALRYARALEAKPQAGAPEVYVLEDGFNGWQALYGEDERLTEGFRKEIWRMSRYPYT